MVTELRQDVQAGQIGHPMNTLFFLNVDSVLQLGKKHAVWQCSGISQPDTSVGSDMYVRDKKMVALRIPSAVSALPWEHQGTVCQLMLTGLC